MITSSNLTLNIVLNNEMLPEMIQRKPATEPASTTVTGYIIIIQIKELFFNSALYNRIRASGSFHNPLSILRE